MPKTGCAHASTGALFAHKVTNLVVLGQTLRSARRARLDLARREADGEIGDERVLRLTRAAAANPKWQAQRQQGHKHKRAEQSYSSFANAHFTITTTAT